jgi:hypothetical protein
MLRIRNDQLLPVVVENLHRLVRVTSRPPIERSLNTIIGGSLTYPYGLTKILMLLHPPIDRRLSHIKKVSDFRDCCAKGAKLPSLLDVLRLILRWTTPVQYSPPKNAKSPVSRACGTPRAARKVNTIRCVVSIGYASPILSSAAISPGTLTPTIVSSTTTRSTMRDPTMPAARYIAVSRACSSALRSDISPVPCPTTS